jgi:hypothetical protein
MSRLTRGILRLLRFLVVGLALLFLAGLWMSGRDLPPAAVRHLERRLSRGPLCVRFDRAAVSLRRGLLLGDVRVFAKRRLGPPALTAVEVRIDGRVRRDRPPLEWIDTLYARNLHVGEIPPLPAAADLLAGGGTGLPFAAGRGTRPSPAPPPPGGLLARPVRLELEEFSLWGMRAERIEAACRLEGPRLRIERLRIELPSREWREFAEGEVVFDLDARTLRAEAEGRLTPEAITPLLERFDADDVLEICRCFGGYTSPVRAGGSLAATLPPAGNGKEELRLSLDGDNLAYRGLPVKRFHATLEWIRDGRERRLTVSPLTAVRDDGRLSCDLVRHPAVKVTDLDLRSTLPFETFAVAMEIEEETAALSNVVFRTAPLIAITGRYASAKSALTTDLRGSLRCESLALRGLPLAEVATTFAVGGNGRFELTDFGARCGQGGLTGSLALARSPAGGQAPRFETRLACRRLSCGTIAGQLGFADSAEGLLDGQVALRGLADRRHLASLNGAGRLTVRQGNIMRVPLFAGFTDYLARNIPGVQAMLQQTDASMPFIITNGVFLTDRLLIEGPVFSLDIAGRCRLRDEGMPLDGVARVHFFKQKTIAALVARVATFPFGKLMEFKVEGPLEKPRWTYIGLIERLRDAAGGHEAPAVPATEEDQEEENPSGANAATESGGRPAPQEAAAP